MHSKTKELAEQAGFVFWADEDWKPEGEVIDWASNYDNEIEKLVQLVVKECISICENENVSNLDLNVMRESGKFTVQDLATKSCGENLANVIRKRFGVTV